jgi:transcription elongation factor Elf1
MTDKNKKEYHVFICPKCRSDDVSAEKNPAYVATGLLTQFKQCNNCGHHGQVFPEVLRSEVPKKPKSIKEIKQRELVQTSFGKGYFKYVIYITIPLSIISAIFLILS